MATKEKDPVSGQYTTGHEWDGIKELNTPLPKWWVWVFFATIVWAVGYWVAMPSFPTLDGYAKGMLGYSSRASLSADLDAAAKGRQAWLSKFETASVEDIKGNPELLNYAMVGGRIAFAENCAPCHQSGGAGAVGYPNLNDDEWIWGGTLADIQTTITHGIRNASADSRVSEMPAYGTGEPMSDAQVSELAEYVLSLSKASTDATAAAAGKAVFDERCVSCHGESGEGQQALGAPALNNGIWLYKGSKADVVAQIKAPKHGAMPAWGGRLDETTIKQLTVYVHSLGGGK